MLKNMDSFNVSIEPTLKETIDKMARNNDLTRSQVVRRMLTHVLKNKKLLHRLFD